MGLFLIGAGCESATLAQSADIDPALAQEALSVDIDFDYGRLILEDEFTGKHGSTIRFKRYEYLGRSKAFVIFLNGRTEWIEKHEPLFTANYEMPWETSENETLADLPVTFISMDHEGQGLSGGLPSHIDSYDVFVSNLKDVIEYNRLRCGKHHRKPIYLMSHSMGGLIAARFAEENPGLVDGLILSSPLFGVNAPAGVTVAQLRQLVTGFSLPAPNGFGFANRCARAPEAPVPVLGALGMCLTNPGCQACFANPTQPGCAELGLDWNAMYTAWGFLNSEASIGCHTVRTPEYSCTFPGPGFNGTMSNFEYCMWTENNPLAGPAQTFGWLYETFVAIDAMNAKIATIADIPTLVLSSPIDPIVSAPAHGAFCSAMSDCTLVELQSNFETGPVYFHELLAETDRASAVTAIRSFLEERLSL
jgi:alpha-beta hydrolase superfamily lysophospholipase